MKLDAAEMKAAQLDLELVSVRLENVKLLEEQQRIETRVNAQYAARVAQLEAQTSHRSAARLGALWLAKTRVAQLEETVAQIRSRAELALSAIDARESVCQEQLAASDAEVTAASAKAAMANARADAAEAKAKAAVDERNVMEERMNQALNACAEASLALESAVASRLAAEEALIRSKEEFDTAWAERDSELTKKHTEEVVQLRLELVQAREEGLSDRTNAAAWELEAQRLRGKLAETKRMLQQNTGGLVIMSAASSRAPSRRSSLDPHGGLASRRSSQVDISASANPNNITATIAAAFTAGSSGATTATSSAPAGANDLSDGGGLSGHVSLSGSRRPSNATSLVDPLSPALSSTSSLMSPLAGTMHDAAGAHAAETASASSAEDLHVGDGAAYNNISAMDGDDHERQEDYEQQQQLGSVALTPFEAVSQLASYMSASASKLLSKSSSAASTSAASSFLSTASSSFTLQSMEASSSSSSSSSSSIDTDLDNQKNDRIDDDDDSDKNDNGAHHSSSVDAAIPIVNALTK